MRALGELRGEWSGRRLVERVLLLAWRFAGLQLEQVERRLRCLPCAVENAPLRDYASRVDVDLRLVFPALEALLRGRGLPLLGVVAQAARVALRARVLLVGLGL